MNLTGFESLLFSRIQKLSLHKPHFFMLLQGIKKCSANIPLYLAAKTILTFSILKQIKKTHFFVCYFRIEI